MASTEARQKLINALVKLSKVSSGGYFGLSKSGGRRKRRGSGLSGGGLSGGAKKRVGRPRKRVGASLGITNISASGLSGGRKRRTTTKRKASGVSGGVRKKRASGGSSWVTFVKKWAKNHNITYGEAMIEAAGPYKRRKPRR